MPNTYASAVYPVVDRYIGLAKEASPGTAVNPAYTFPMAQFKWVDKITPLKDMAWRNSMAELYNLIKGVRIDDLSMGGPVFADGIGYLLANTLGDYWQAVNGTSTTPTTLASPFTAGGTSVSVTANTGLSTGATFAVGSLSTLNEEVRTVATISGGGPYTVTFTTPMYQNHANGNPVTAYTAVNTYVHNFSLLNSGTGMGGFTSCQPPTYTFTDWTGVSATSGARQMAYTCLSELTISGMATGLIEWEGKASALASAIPVTKPAVTLSTDQPWASWISTVSVGGSQIFDNAEFKLSLARKIEPKFVNANQQDPTAIPRGALTAGLGVNFDPVSNESDFLHYLNWDQPTLAVTASNGLTNALLRQVVISGQVTGYDTGEYNDSKEVFGVDETAQMVANTTNAGPSGGFSPCAIAVTNSVVAY